MREEVYTKLITIRTSDKIKTKALAKKFLDTIQYEMYFTGDPDFDYCISITKDGKMLTQRPVFARDNVFNPYSEVVEKGKSREDIAVDFIWKHRKLINRTYFK